MGGRCPQRGHCSAVSSQRLCPILGGYVDGGRRGGAGPQPCTSLMILLVRVWTPSVHLVVGNRRCGAVELESVREAGGKDQRHRCEENSELPNEAGQLGHLGTGCGRRSDACAHRRLGPQDLITAVHKVYTGSNAATTCRTKLILALHDGHTFGLRSPSGVPGRPNEQSRSGRDQTARHVRQRA